MRKIKKGLEYIFKVLVMAVFIFPFLWMIITAFKTYKEAIAFPPTLIPKTFNLDSFKQAWNSGPFLTYTKNSIIVTLSVIVLQFIIMIPAAYGFARYDFKGKGILFSVVLLSFMTPQQITFIPTYLMMAKWGVLKTLIPQIIPFAANAFGIFLLRQHFMQIPTEVIESVRIDGANEVQIMFRIMVPMSKGTLATIALFAFVSHWNSYFWPLVMTNTVDVRPLTIGIAMLKATEGIVNWPVIMAGNTILVLPILLFYAFAHKYIMEAFTYSGIK